MATTDSKVTCRFHQTNFSKKLVLTTKIGKSKLTSWNLIKKVLPTKINKFDGCTKSRSLWP